MAKIKIANTLYNIKNYQYHHALSYRHMRSPIWRKLVDSIITGFHAIGCNKKSPKTQSRQQQLTSTETLRKSDPEPTANILNNFRAPDDLTNKIIIKQPLLFQRPIVAIEQQAQPPESTLGIF